ncbi:uncharacterized protein LOC131688365 [Topomyia yanbarensis]|uniref:uncharacterized protein LOC131688365 n=1 Tax=Topomyia yanbarensis TaxID=2498891 RepID=UPI00273AA2B2|nr:uncharacterized protein LOC131688365 [Topomyia yanbarensis]
MAAAGSSMGLKPPKPLVLSDNMADQWRSWYRQYKWFSTATNLQEKPGSVQAATLLSAIGPDCIKILDTFGLRPEQEENIELIVTRFTEYFTPKSCVTYERYHFNKLEQKEDELFDTFVTRVREQAKKCAFSVLHDSLVKDKLIVGTKQVNEIKGARNVDEDSEAEEEFYVHTIEDSNDDDWFETIEIHGRKITVKLDSGAQCNVLPKRALRDLPVAIKPSMTKNLVTYNCQKIAVLGEISPVCMIKDLTDSPSPEHQNRPNCQHWRGYRVCLNVAHQSLECHWSGSGAHSSPLSLDLTVPHKSVRVHNIKICRCSQFEQPSDRVVRRTHDDTALHSHRFLNQPSTVWLPALCLAVIELAIARGRPTISFLVIGNCFEAPKWEDKTNGFNFGCSTSCCVK